MTCAPAGSQRSHVYILLEENVTLPNFLGIGTMRSGTTWLDVQLRSHPAIYLPARRKEVHFFDEYYHRGLGWYQQFFPPAHEAPQYKAIGEITPQYIYNPEAPCHIRACIPDCKLIAILRNPVERAYSEYGLRVRNRAVQQPFSSFLEQERGAYERGFYTQQLERYLRYFPRHHMLVLIFERVTHEPQHALTQVAEFLQVAPDLFNQHTMHQRIGVSYRPRLPRARAIAKYYARWLRRRDMDWLPNLAKALGILRMFGNRGAFPPMEAGIRAALLKSYEPDIAALEKLLGEDLSLWRESGT
jgi:Sulfotransferase domain